MLQEIPQQRILSKEANENDVLLIFGHITFENYLYFGISYFLCEFRNYFKDFLKASDQL